MTTEAERRAELIDTLDAIDALVGTEPWLVTVKLPPNRAHDPANKITGPCPVNGGRCTDTTGRHHTVLVHAATAAAAEAAIRAAHRLHITRIEAV